MEKKRVEVKINGQTHAFLTKESEEYVTHLATALTERLASVVENGGRFLSNDKKYLAVAMNVLDDYYKLLAKYDEATDNTDKSAVRDNVVVEEYTNQINSLRKDNAVLRERLKGTEYELKYVQSLYEELRQEYEDLMDAASPAAE